MIMPQSSDSLQWGQCPRSGLRLALVETVDSARILDQRHAGGTTAALLLSEALSAVALLGSEAAPGPPWDVLRLELEVEGPVQGLCVEVTSDGALRGFTLRKHLQGPLYDHEETEARAALGETARATIRRHHLGRVTEEIRLVASPALPEQVVRLYWWQAFRTPVVVLLTSLAYGAYLEMARGLLIAPRPNASPAVLKRFESMYESGLLLEALESESSLLKLCLALELPDILPGPVFPLHFGCVCSDARVDRLLSQLSSAELDALGQASPPAPATCQMCGARYPVSLERLAAARRARQNRP